MARRLSDWSLRLSRFSVLTSIAYVVIALCGIPFAAGQTGFPPFNSFQKTGFDSINEGTLNVHAEWVIGHADEIGMPLNIRLTFDSGSGAVWYKRWNSRQQIYEWARTQTSAWQTVLPGPTGYLTLTQPSSNGSCGTFAGSYTDEHNTVHTFSNLVLTAENSQTACPTPVLNGGALDGSGYIITGTNADGKTGACNAQVTDAHGNITKGNMSSLCGTAIFQTTDSNGNAINQNWSAFPQITYTNTLGSNALTFTDTLPNVTLGFTGGNGATSASLHYSSVPYATSFGCTGISNISGATNQPDGVTLADGSNYTFQYDSQGFLTQINLPQGGNIKYVYTETVDCTAGTVTVTGLTRTTYDNVSQVSGQWTYAQTGTQASSTTTETAPSGDKQVIAFQNYSEVDRKLYTGPSTLLKEIVHCYNYSSAATCTTQTGANSAGSPPKALTELTYLNGSTSAARTVTYYGNAAPYVTGIQLAIPTEIDSYDFGAGTPAKKVLTPTGSWNGSSCAAIGSNILDRPCEINVMDSGNNVYSSTALTYDAKGNATAVSRYTGSRWLTTQYVYDTNGTVSKTIDPNGGYVTYTNKICGAAPYAYPQSIQAYNSGGVLLPYPSSTLTYDPNCNSSKPFSITDANGQTTSYAFNDPLWRLTATTDPLQNTQGIIYTPSTVESTLTFGTSTLDNLTTLDGLGRSFLTQRREAPGSSNFDTVKKGYDANGRLASVGLPCVSIASQPCTSSTSNFTYDGLDRPTQQTDGGGGYVSSTYALNDSLVTLGPAPTGENTKRVQTQYDGLRRPTSICQILSSGGSSCLQSTSASGSVTSYAYSSFAGGTQTSATRGVQTRTSVYDGLGRLTSQIKPESGTTSITYDSVSGTCSVNSYGDMVKRMDANGNWTCYSYDVLHRPTDVGNNNQGSTNVCRRYRYDNTQGVLGAIPLGVTVSNTMGRLVEAETDNCSSPITQSSMITDEWFSYDKDGRLTDLYELTPHSGGYYHTTVGYFANGAVSSLSGLPGYATYSYTVDGEGRPNTAIQGTTTFINGVSYNPANQPTTVAVGKLGDQDIYTYDPATGRMQTYNFTVNSVSDSASLTWNANGTLRQLAITDGFDSGGTQTCTFGTSSVMGYDDLGRLLSNNCGSLWSQTFSYDQYDNLTKAGSSSWAPGYNASNNQYLAPATYDSSGNVLYDLTNRYTWDVYGKMASVRPGTSSAVCGTNGTCVTYDGLGRAVEKNVSGTYTEILYSPLGKTAQMSGQTVTSVYLPLPGGLSLYDASGGHHVEHRDWRGSVVLRTSLNNRTKDYDRAFAPFGEMYDNFGNSGMLNFTGDTQDLFSGLFDTPNRELAPTQGRWISPDPAEAGWNLYAYASNTPLVLTDPSGLRPDNPHWENFDARVYVFDSYFDSFLNPGDAFIQAAIHDFQVQAGLNSPMEQALAIYQSCVSLNFSCDMYGQPAVYDIPALVEAQKQALADAMSNASDSADGSNWDAIYNSLTVQYDQDGNVIIQGGHVDFAWTGDASLLNFVPQPDWTSGGCSFSCRYGSMDAIHFNNNAFHLDTAGANWGYGLGAFLHFVFDVGLGNNPGNIPMNPVVF